MGIAGVQFSSNGKLTSHRNPGSFSDNVYDAGSAGSVAAGNAVIIGESSGGTPFTLYCFGSDGAAGEVLGKGALREGVRAAFNPGGGFKPQKIYAMSVNTKTKAALELSNKMKLLSTAYGIAGNNLKIKLSSSQNDFSVQVKNKLETVLNAENYSHKPMTIINNSDKNLDIHIDKNQLEITKDEIISGTDAIASSGTLQNVEFSSIDGVDYTINFAVDENAETITCEYANNTYSVTSLPTSTLDEILAAINNSNPNTTISSTSESLPDGGLTGTVSLSDGKVKVPDEIKTFSETFSFETYSTVEELVEAVNEVFSESADIQAVFNTEAKSSDLSSNLDNVNATLYPDNEINLTSNLHYMIQLLESTGLIEVDTTEMSQRTFPDAVSSFTPFSGGDNGQCTTVEYEKALELLKKENIQLISTTSEDEPVHLLIKSHCEECNSRTGKRERQAIVGGKLNESVVDVKERAKTIGSEFVALCSPGYYDYDYSDPLRQRKKYYSPAFYACKMLGQQAAMEVGEPSTKKEVSHFGWEKEYSDTELDELIEAGVWCGEKETNEYGTTRFQTARSITTSKEDNILLVEFSVIREELYISRDLRAAVNTKTIGVKGLDSLTASQETKVKQRLDDYKKRGLLRTYDTTSVKVSVDGDVTKIEWSGCPALPNNFNFITNKYTVYRDKEDN